VGSYNLIFAVALSTCLITLFISAYLYDVARKAVDDTVTHKEVVTSKALTMISMIVTMVSVVILFIVFFAMKKGCIVPKAPLVYRSAVPSAPYPSAVNGVY